MKKLLFFLLLSMSTSSLFGEYILYKTSEEKIIALDQDEHEKAFEILIKYQFPMSLNFFHGTDQKNWTNEHWDLLKDEEKFIQNKLDELKLGIKMAFMPKTLYELFFIYFCFEHSFNFFEAIIHRNYSGYLSEINKLFEFYEKTYKTFLYNNKWDEATFLQDSEKINENGQVLHFHLNTRIIAHLKPFQFDLVLQNTFGLVAKVLLHKIRRLDSQEKIVPNDGNYMHKAMLGKYYKENISEKIITECVKYEIVAHKKQQWLLYRGSSKIKDSTKNGDAAYSNSYGNSLFSGVVFDFGDDGATVFNYCLMREFRHCLTINIQEYCKKKAVYQLFYIAPFGFTGLFLDGEDFHSRSKIHDNYYNNKLIDYMALNHETGSIRGRDASNGFLNEKYIITPLIDKITQEEFDKLFRKYTHKNKKFINPKFIFNERTGLIKKQPEKRKLSDYENNEENSFSNKKIKMLETLNLHDYKYLFEQ